MMKRLIIYYFPLLDKSYVYEFENNTMYDLFMSILKYTAKIDKEAMEATWALIFKEKYKKEVTRVAVSRSLRKKVFDEVSKFLDSGKTKFPMFKDAKFLIITLNTIYSFGIITGLKNTAEREERIEDVKMFSRLLDTLEANPHSVMLVRLGFVSKFKTQEVPYIYDRSRNEIILQYRRPIEVINFNEFKKIKSEEELLRLLR